jgi:hypothetical protein
MFSFSIQVNFHRQCAQIYVLLSKLEQDPSVSTQTYRQMLDEYAEEVERQA